MNSFSPPFPTNSGAATLYSLIETGKACGVELYRYLRILFSKIPWLTPG